MPRHRRSHWHRRDGGSRLRTERCSSLHCQQERVRIESCTLTLCVDPWPLALIIGLVQTADRLNKLGPGKCEYIVADLKDKAGCDKLVAGMKKKTDRLTVLVNNTGATW